MKSYSLKTLAVSAGIFLTGVAGFQTSAEATVLYGTSIEGTQLFSYDTSTHALNTVLGGPAADSLAFDLSGRIIYTAIWAGQVRRYDPVTHVDELLAGGLNTPADLLLEPGGNSVLVSQYGSGSITRINLNTFTTTTLASGLVNPEGLAYDNSGRLFANIGTRDFGANKQVAQIDPVTGAILNQSVGLYSLDGLTFDKVTGHLWASALYANGFYEIDPTTLAATAHKFGGIGTPDGITSDGLGNIFLASRGDYNIYDYNIAADTLTALQYVYGLDDLAPAAGLGSKNDVPEPATLGIVLTALGFMAGLRRSRKSAS